MQYAISGKTRFGGLLGSPVAHSLSPAMHNASFQKLGIDCVYLAFDVTQEMLDGLSTAARLIGAVNTVVNQDGKLIGHNTDGIGYVESIRENGIEIEGSEITLLGAGGAAAAAAVQMALDGARKIHIANRRSRFWEEAGRLVDTINRETQCRADLTDLSDSDALAERIAASSLLTNATSVGMAPGVDETPIRDLSVFQPDRKRCDLQSEGNETDAGCKRAGVQGIQWNVHASVPGRGCVPALDRPGDARGVYQRTVLFLIQRRQQYEPDHCQRSCTGRRQSEDLRAGCRAHGTGAGSGTGCH